MCDYREAVCMLPETEFDEVVRFDVPPEYAEMLWAWLKPIRFTWLHKTDEGRLLVATALGVELEDLAQLMRDVEIWLAVSNLPFLRFVLDGREYVLLVQNEQSVRAAA